MKLMLAPVLLLSTLAMAQSSALIAVKPSPASDALNHAAQESITQQKSFDTLLAQARTGVEANQKSMQADIQKANTDLLADLKADKKYKDRIAAIDDMQKKLQDIGQQADQKFGKESGPIQNELNKNKALIEGLTPVVRKENDLPPTATYDTATQKWTAPKVEDKSAEPKK